MGKKKTKPNYKIVRSLQKKADTAMQEFYRNQDMNCEVCGGVYSCKHHFFPKSKASALRYYEPNLISICVSCHFGHHNGDPRIHIKIKEQRGQEWWEDLLSRKEAIVKPNQAYYKEVIERYS